MSLIAPLFLLGLIALIVPWWLHRISTDDPPQQEFGSSMLLQEQQTVSSRHTRLRYWGLLSLRTLAVALLALLFAEPALKQLAGLTQESTRHLLVIDTSLSQSHTARWARTTNIAHDIVDGLPAGDEVSVIAAGDTLQQLAEEDYSKATAKTRIDALQPDLTRLEYNRFTRAIAADIRNSNKPVAVHFVSDMQQSAMPERFSELAITGITNLQLYSTAQDDDNNTSVTATVNELADNLADLSVLVNNHGPESVTREVLVSSEDGVLQRQSVQLDAATRTQLRFAALDTQNASGRLTVTLSPTDAVTADDSYTVAIPDGQRSDIPVITGTDHSLANTYVIAALESDPRYRARTVAGTTLSASEAGATVIVPDAAALTDRAASRLSDYIEAGGSALVFAGSTPHSTNMRALLRISGNPDATAINNFRITTSDPTQPLIKGLASDWRALRIQQKLTVASAADDAIILTTDDGQPLLIERTAGGGRLLILTTALNPSWSQLAIEPLFVAFIIRSVEYLQGETTANPYRSIGQSVSLAPGAQLLNANGESLRDITELTTRSRYTFTEPGVYTIKSGSGNRYLSVNVDPRESAIEPLDNTLIEQWKNLGSDPAGNRSADTAQTATDAQSPTHTRSLWYWILLLLAFIVLAESLYSHRHLSVKRGWTKSGNP